VDKALDGSSIFEAGNRELIRKWLLGALLNGVFGGNSDQTIGTSRQLIKDAMMETNEFPYDVLCDGLYQKRGRVVGFDGKNLDALLDTKYSHKTCFLALSLLYDEQNWGSSLYHIDHIIPRSLCSRKALQGQGLSEDRIKQIIECVDHLGNLQLLPASENSAKSNQPFSDWIKTRDSGFLSRHLIPTEPHLWTPENLPAFVAAREKAIKERVTSLNTITPSTIEELAEAGE
jgi:hypothetical protein